MNPEIWKVVLGAIVPGLTSWLDKRKAEKAERAAKAQEAADRKTIPPKHPRLLLIVEDDENDVELLKYYLRQANDANPEKYAVEIEVANNTDDAWTAYLLRHHQLVLVDMRFPQGEQGWVFAEKVRRHSVNTQIVIVYTNVEDILKLPSGQIFSYIRKPPTYEGILQLLAKLR